MCVLPNRHEHSASRMLGNTQIRRNEGSSSHTENHWLSAITVRNFLLCMTGDTEEVVACSCQRKQCLFGTLPANYPTAFFGNCDVYGLYKMSSSVT